MILMIIYEYIFILWNISNNNDTLYIFDNDELITIFLKVIKINKCSVCSKTNPQLIALINHSLEIHLRQSNFERKHNKINDCLFFVICQSWVITINVLFLIRIFQILLNFFLNFKCEFYFLWHIM